MKLFNLVDETVELLNENTPRYSLVEKQVNNFLVGVVEENENYIGFSSRIKSESSLRSKIIKRKYYLEYDSAEMIIDNLSDVIGITLECRFKEDEIKIYNQLQEAFNVNGEMFSQSKDNERLYMNFKTEQPQKQNNGFEIYRIDGYYILNDEKVNFELQIKSLINIFWSGIEHEVIYKNNNYLMFDSFLKEMLLSVKMNLDTIDSQLTQIYTEMTHKSNDSIGMDGTNFKGFLGKEINNLFSFKLKETAEIDINIKKISALLSHYLYLEEFVKSATPQMVMLDYFEKLDLLSKIDMDFTVEIELNEENNKEDKFQEIFGGYCRWIMNVDFDWHVLFSMLFMMQEDEVVVQFNKFVNFIKNLLFTPQWFRESVEIIEKSNECENFEEEIYTLVANCLINQQGVFVIYEENLYKVMMIIRMFIEGLIEDINNEYVFDIEERYNDLVNEINDIFK